MLKVKRFDDAEATVIDHEKGKGRLFDVCGALVMQEKNGTEFRIGSGMDDKMIVTKINVLGADLVWTSMWIVVALALYYSTSTNVKQD